MTQLPMSLLLLACSAACTRRVPPDSNCEWPHETATSIDLTNPAQQRHLSDDAQVAEDRAIRYADSHSGPRSGHFAGFDKYARAREQCMAALFQVIAKNHGVTQEQVRESLKYRRTSLDLGVLLSFAVLYGFAASGFSRRVWRRFPFDEGWVAGAVATVIASAIVSLGGVMVGEIWSTTLEEMRIGNGHLSYRVARIPWNQHRLSLFVCGVVLFWLIAGFQYRTAARQVPGNAGRELNW
jgi:hypothetical protein